MKDKTAGEKSRKDAEVQPCSVAVPADLFERRHIGPREEDVRAMLEALGLKSLEALAAAAVPESLRLKSPLAEGRGRGEHEVLQELRELASQNEVFRSYIGMGYHDCATPPVILRNVLENAGWYTAYTPYQAEISQGRLEALLNFQTMVADLTGLPVANASMLDEATAAAEAMALSRTASPPAGDERVGGIYFAASDLHPQTLEVVFTRAKPLGIQVVVGDPDKFDFKEPVFGALVQYPSTDGVLRDYGAFCRKAREKGALVTVATDLLALTFLAPPGEFGADIAVGSAQRFGVPLGYGGPHAAFLAVKDELKRLMPGRVVGVSKDVHGRAAYRLALQTREQHIRREKATSNICTAQVLLAVVASMYAVYHGPGGLKRIAGRVHLLTRVLAEGLRRLGYRLGEEPFFDTVRVGLGQVPVQDVMKAARSRGINLRALDERTLTVSLDETVTEADLKDLWEAFALGRHVPFSPGELCKSPSAAIPAPFARKSAFLEHPVFNSHHSEMEMQRYIWRLQAKDLSLVHSMIPLGSCTMKLNAAAEMLPVTWPEFGRLHPFAPPEQAKGYQALFRQLETMLADLTGFDRVSFMPNAGSQGEYAGLLVIGAYHEHRGQGARDVCLIPSSAHGTNPASAAMAGMQVVVVDCDASGNIDVKDLKSKAEAHKDRLAALMVTYPSTHGVYEETIQEVARVIHENGGQVYMDGANFNALVGLARPADFGADVSHLNLHKTFCIPHGGGGPGMGPIGVKAHLAPFLPRHPAVTTGGVQGIGPVSAAPWGSASILPISWAYIRMMGSDGLTRATQTAILNANYVARRLEPSYPVLYKGKNGLVAHECILDLRPLKSADVTVEDVAKRLMDYGFHAPTVSFPVAGTLMIEPTESESKEELDRFCEAMASIRAEVREIEEGKADRKDNLLKNAPLTAAAAVADSWTHPYPRERAAFPVARLRESKYWPPVGRIDAAWGDRNFFCTCPPP